AVQLGWVRDEAAGPATARTRVVADHGAAPDHTLVRPATESVLAPLAGGAWLEAALQAGEHRVHDDPVADAPAVCVRAHLDDPADVLVAEHERVGAEGLERERVVCRDSRQVAAADAAQGSLDTHPVIAGQCWGFDLVQCHTAEGAERHARASLRRSTGEE